jgi:O-antigen ligase
MNNQTTDFTDYPFFSFLKIHYLLIIYFLSCTFSIGISQLVLLAAAVLWCYGLLRKPDIFKIKKSGLELWIIIYIFISILAILFSADVKTSLSHSKHFTLLIILIFGVQALVNGKKVRLYFTICIIGGVINCLYALYKFFQQGEGGLERRLHGFIDSWMTFSGFTMIIFLILLAKIIWGTKSKSALLYCLAGLLLLVTIVLSMTRSSWVGLFFGILVLTFLHSRKIFVLALSLILLIGIISFPYLPVTIKTRFLSIFDARDTTNRERIFYAIIAKNIIKKHPLLGIGPGTLNSQLQYYVSEGIDKNWGIPHLHSNIFQIAASKGLLGLLSWLMLFLKWLYDAVLIYFKKKSDYPDLVAGAIAAVTAFQIAGLFEYNYGDSEIIMLILFIMTVPYADPLSFFHHGRHTEK